MDCECRTCEFFCGCYCRRRPPTICTVQAYDDDSHEWAEMISVTRWPEVNNIDWCGEYKPRGES